MNRRIVCTLVLLLPTPLHAQRTAEFAVAAKPLTAIGFPDSPENEQLTNVTGAKRLSDGRVVVANGKPLSLRIYSPQGKFLSVLARKGSGPGEFMGAIDLLATGGDSVLAFDEVNYRLTLFSPSGKVVKEWPSSSANGSPRGQSILYHRTLVQQASSKDNACIRQVLDGMGALALPAMREMFPDRAGRFWEHADRSENWIVHAADGKAIGAVHLPKGVEVYEVGDKYVVGKVLLEDDIEQVRVFSVATPPAPPRPACMNRSDSFPATDSPGALALKAVLRSSMTGMEMFYSNYASYPTTVDSMRDFKAKLPPTVVARVLGGDRFGYSIIAFDRTSSLACAFRAGRSLALGGWPDMGMRCTP